MRFHTVKYLLCWLALTGLSIAEGPGLTAFASAGPAASAVAGPAASGSPGLQQTAAASGLSAAGDMGLEMSETGFRQVSEGLKINLPARASVSYGSLRLGDFAEISGAAEKVQAASDIELGQVISGNFSARYGISTLMVYLRAAGLAQDEIQWIGADMVEISANEAGSEDNTGTAWTIEEALLDFAYEMFPEDYLIVNVHTPLPVQLREGVSNLVVDRPFIPSRGGDISVPVSFTRDNGVTSRTMVRARVDVTRNVWIATRRIERGEEFSVSDFRQEPRSLAQTANAVSNIQSLDNSVAVRPIDAGQILNASFYREQPVIRRGQIVSVLYNRGALQLDASAESLGDAMAGQMVSVKLKSTNKVLRGTAYGRGTVIIR